jgi:hypothetical protein
MHIVINGRLGLRGPLAVLLGLTAVGCLGDHGPCWSYTQVPEWCDGDKYMTCSQGSEVTESVPEMEKVCDPGMCVQWTEKDRERAGCKASGSPCDRAQCVGTVAAYCSSRGVLIKLQDCSQDSIPGCALDDTGWPRCVVELQQ